MLIVKGKTNWVYVAIVFLSAAITGAYLIFYINSEVALGASGADYSSNK